LYLLCLVACSDKLVEWSPIKLRCLCTCTKHTSFVNTKDACCVLFTTGSCTHHESRHWYMTTPQCGNKQHSAQHSPVVELTVTHIISMTASPLLIVSGGIHHCCSVFKQLNEQALCMHSLAQSDCSVQYVQEQGYRAALARFQGARQVRRAYTAAFSDMHHPIALLECTRTAPSLPQARHRASD
jgi:hypothetical protein